MTTLDAVTAYRQFLTELCNGDFALADRLVSADCVFHVAGAADATYRGPAGLRSVLQGARCAPAPPGTAVAFGGHDFLRFRDGQFVEYWGGADDAHLMTQLGMFG